MTLEECSFIRIPDIQRTVADIFGIPHAAMISKRRKREWCRPRQIAMYLCCEVAGYSLSRVGQAFHKDHSTVFHAIRAVRGWPQRTMVNGRRVDQVIEAVSATLLRDEAA